MTGMIEAAMYRQNAAIIVNRRSGVEYLQSECGNHETENIISKFFISSLLHLIVIKKLAR
jgi:hypothetical protein